MPTTPVPSRRGVLTGAAALAAAGYVAPAEATPGSGSQGSQGNDGSHRTRLTILGTTDLHGHVFNWDYYKNVEYDDAAHNDIGVAKVQTLIKAQRELVGGDPLLVIDAGDTIQGTPLSYYYARVEPITAAVMHPMANAMNLVGYDAAALGNHEFNYGIPLLRTFESQLNFPLLGANAVDPASGLPVFQPYLIKTIRIPQGPDLTVGILGLTNPGIAIWDRDNVAGKIAFPGLVEQAKVFVPKLKSLGCDIVVIAAHSGATPSSSYGDALPYPENASSDVAQQVPDVDAILVGHAHVDVPEKFVTNTQTGKQVLLCEPHYWGMRLAVMQLDLVRHGNRWSVATAHSQNLNAKTAAEDLDVANAVRSQHDKVIAYVNTVIGTSLQAMSAARAPVEDVPIIDFVNYVQADAVKQGLTGADAGLPVLSIAAPFNRSASFRAGEVTRRDVAGLYIYDNFLFGVRVTGAQVKDYLEYSMRYFKQVSGPGPFAMADVTNAVTPTAPAPYGTPDYNFDVIAGLDARLTYDIDIAQPVGSRILDLQYAGAAVPPDQQFAMAVNNYRQSGGGGFPAVKTAPVIYSNSTDIRQLLLNWVAEHHTIDASQFASVDWRLVSNGQPITIT